MGAKACLIFSAISLLAAGASAQPAPPLSQGQSAAIAQALAHSDQEGFAPGEFTGADTPLFDAALAYARAEHGLRISTAAFPADWAIRPGPYDARADLDAALAGDRLDAWLQSLPPPDLDYGRLVIADARYRALADQGGWPLLAETAKPGDSGPWVAALRQRLAIEDPGLTSAAKDSASDHYDAGLQAAVARAQTRYGLTADGVAGRATLAALNVPIAARLDQIRANLERRRWMPRSLPAYRAELNIADASLKLYAPSEPVLEMRAVVGEPKKPTPMFEDHIKAVIFNPPWNVPRDIADSEIWPKIRKDPGYMKREGFVVLANGTLQQRPGPDCALGSIKFDLSNPFGVYLHDTPARTLFSQDTRDLSHGCMRLENPHGLAKRLVVDDPQWQALRVDTVLLSGQTTRAPLASPVPLYVGYWTVFLDDDGVVNFRADIYHWDQKLIALLARPASRTP
jgi:murein L,D-transpeptidase YcbB/YkuD